jgi:hypothetical protein
MSASRDLWFENALLLGLLALLVCVYVNLPSRQAQAAGGGWDTDGIIAFSGTSGGKILLIDTVKRNMCLYKTRSNEFRLVGARSFKYDVEIEDSAGSEMERTGWTYHQVWRQYEQGLTKTKAGVGTGK